MRGDSLSLAHTPRQDGDADMGNDGPHCLLAFMGQTTISPAIHRKWAREFLGRAERASDRHRKLGYLKLAVTNSVRAQVMEADDAEKPPPPSARK
jgi:hypothetical protein